ncbi:histidine phosphatase family protein [Balneola sp. MJW-20]|uniref:histidine phosphatase family protein n=1 Tax=Gracilimonas aurantiaca TaxID=3234185 RepID=UPI003465D3A3
MKTLFIIRHGETDVNKAQKIQGRSINASINDTGFRQASAVNDYLKSHPVERIVVSSLKRTIETAAPLIERVGLVPESYTELDEMNFGVLEGKVFPNIRDQIEIIHQQWSSGNTSFAPDEGESPEEVFLRASGKVHEILKEAEEEHIVFILHGRLIRILLSEWLGLGLKNMHQIEHTNGGINRLFWDGDRFEAEMLNYTGHL